MGSLSFPICFHLVEFRGVEVLRNRNPLFFGPIICVRSALYGSGYSTPSLRASTMIHRHVIEIGSRSPSCLLRTWLLVVHLSTCPERITALYSAPSVCPSIPRACRRVSSRVLVYVHVVTDKSSGKPRNHKYIAEPLPRKRFPTIVVFHRITTSMMQARSVKHTYLSVVVLHTRAILVCGRGVLREICMHGYQVPG